MLRATTACNFSSLIWPAGSAPAALASLLFSTLRSHKSLEKQSVSRRSYLFAHLHLLSSDLFSSDSSHLCFSTVHIVGSFTSKLPSITLHYATTTTRTTTTTTTTTALLHTTLDYTTVHNVTVHYSTLHYTTVHYSTLQYATVHYSTLHYITVQYTTLHYITRH